ncbi:hypothetical protein QUA42_25920 [Microcoleus sp. Pol11C2]|uniref:hypothetical protein n=1 Tax=Microcoleus sp. Pol11C2 TaxID=3055389 RepID=UPI002FD77E36
MALLELIFNIITLLNYLHHNKIRSPIATSLQVTGFQPLTLVRSQSKIQNRLTAAPICGYALK